ncbi:MAG: class I adenylate cyclase [Gammaproteobacteria bacterium]|nr:class I adenylate cyclase [Gammaproteobacteria bacterium]
MSQDAQWINDVRQRFVSLNQQRIERCISIMQPKQKDFLELLPLLFHINNISLPGYVGPDTPHGVSAYALEEKTLVLARRLWRGFDVQKRAQWSFAIDSIFLMGSVGSIAFSNKSDFDVWLCYNPAIKENKLDSLQKKATAIENWAEELGLEVHFFLMNANEFKEGKLVDLSTESSGSAQHRLLLDEFYRTGVWVAGKHPFWWFIPVENEHDYESLKAKYLKDELLDEQECVDFGGLPNIPAEEFLGAAVWQLNKAIDSPYKSLLKITLMEAYASDYPNGATLSSLFKREVHNGNTDLNTLDPYIMLMRYLEQYIGRENEKGRLELVRISFYFKVGIALSQMSTQMKKDWREKMLRETTFSWGWTDVICHRLDTYKDWRIDDVIKARQPLVDNLTKSYMLLSDFARKMNKESLIKQRDLTILGRKLYAVYDKKPGKIEIVSHGFKTNISEELVTFLQAKGKSGDRWLLYRGKVTGADFKDFKPLKTTSCLVELMVWAYFNRVVNLETRKMLYAPGCDMKNSVLHTLLEDISHLCKNPQNFSADSDVLKYSPYVKETRFYINIGRIPRMVGEKIEKEIISGGLDVLKYGSMDDSLVSSMEFVYTTSWNEVYVMQYEEMEGIFHFFCDFLNFCLDKDGNKSRHPLSIPEFCTVASHFGHIINRRVESLVRHAYEFFFEKDNNERGIFVTEAAKNIFVVERKEKKFTAQRFSSLSQLVAFMSMPVNHFRGACIDEQSLNSQPLRSILEMNEPGKVQVFYEKGKKGSAVWILDENGALSVQQYEGVDTFGLLHDYYQFIADSLKHYACKNDEESEIEREFLHRENELLGFYNMKKEGLKFKITEMDLMNLRHAQIPYDLLAHGDLRKGKTVFKFTFKGQELSSAELGSKVFDEVRKQVGVEGKISITRMVLSPELMNLKKGQKPSIQHLLNYKKRIEEKLNK